MTEPERYIDFDAMMEETEQKAPPTIRLKGSVFTLPQHMPAMLMIKALRLKQAPQTTADKKFVDDIESMFISLFGDQWESVMALGYGIEELVTMLQKIMEMYQGNAPTPTPEPGASGT